MPRKNAGFTLIELSIVLVIIGIMAYGAMALVAIEADNAKIRQTNERLDAITRALQLYYETHGAMPCPADGALAVENTNFGLASAGTPPDGTVSHATCGGSSFGAVYYGVVPTRTLDLQDNYMIDGWSDRISYVVSKNCIDPNNWTTTLGPTASTTISPYGCVDNTSTPAAGATSLAGGKISVQDNAGNIRTTSAVYIIISHGKNKIGAWGYNGGAARIATGNPSIGTREVENTDFSADALFTDDILNDYEGAADYFDDITRWKTGPQIQYEKYN